MKTFVLLIMMSTLSSSVNWLTNFGEAKQKAKQEHKLILLNFSGSDWCGPCMRMRKEIFGSDEFTAIADTKLVLINADFPRMKKNQLLPAQQKANDQLADHYNPKGIFPLTVLLNEDGTVLKSWEGLFQGTSAEFTFQLNEYLK